MQRKYCRIYASPNFVKFCFENANHWLSKKFIYCHVLHLPDLNMMFFRISTLSVSTFLLRLLCVFYHEIKVWELRNGDTRWLLLSTHGRWLCKFVRQKKMPNKKFLSKSSFHLMLIVDWSENRISVKVLGLLILGVTGFDTNFFMH